MASTLVEVLMVVETGSELPGFTVDTAVDEVNLVSGDGDGVLQNAFGGAWLQRMDSVTLLDMGIFLPYQFGLGSEPVVMELRWLDEANVNEIVISRTFIPGACSVSFAAGASLGQFLKFPAIDAPLGWPARAKMGLKVVSGKISMVNVPENFPDSTELFAIPWVRVQHNLDMEPES